MNLLDIYSMFLLGLLGTGHCLGMCGPLIFAFPGQTGKMISHLYYHSGRILTYTAIGVFMGTMGFVLAMVASSIGKDPLQWLTRIRVGFSLLAACFLFLFGILRLGLVKEPKWMSIAGPDQIPGYKRIIHAAVSGKNPAANFPLGIILGFLPCGMSFAAFARVLASGGPITGGLLVFAFGVGTLPGLLLFGCGAHGFVRRFRKYSDLISGALMIGMGVRLVMKSLPALF